MIQPVKHFAVNWVDGMKVSREHFTQQEDFMLDALRDTASLPLNAFNYGLLPAADPYDKHTLYEIRSTATNDAQLIIRKCAAITMAGHRVEIADYEKNLREISARQQADSGEADGEFYILASVNPFDKIPFGDIDSEEIPPRHPFTRSNYRIELVETAVLHSSFSGGNYLVLGKVDIRSGIARIDPHYIPPCTSVESHPRLVEYYETYSGIWSNLRQYCFRILQKAAHQNQNNTLAENVKTMCRSLVGHLSENYFRFRNMVPSQPPVYLINIYSQLALRLYNDTQMMVPAELEEMLNYSLEWSEVAPHTILKQLTSVAEIQYTHHDSGEIFSNILLLLKSLEQIMGKLSELEYIGQRKENIIVNEQAVRTGVDPRKGWSVID